MIITVNYTRIHNNNDLAPAYEKGVPEDEILHYHHFPNKRPKQHGYFYHELQPNKEEFIPYNTFQKHNQKIMKPQMTPLRKRSKKPKNNYQQAFESSTDDVMYEEALQGALNSSKYEDNRFSYAPAPLPPRSHHKEIMSNISSPILQKEEDLKIDSPVANPYLITEYHRQIETIITSGTSKKPRLISNILISINRSLLLTIDSYINFAPKEGSKDDVLGMSFDSQISQTFEQGRFHNGSHVMDKLKGGFAEFTLTNNTLMKILKLVKNYCENEYVKYIIMSNIAVAF
jgi:hypothetical protein